MTASVREVEQRKVAAAIAAVQAYLESEAPRGQNDSSGISSWRRDVVVSGVDIFTERNRSWTGRN